MIKIHVINTVGRTNTRLKVHFSKELRQLFTPNFVSVKWDFDNHILKIIPSIVGYKITKGANTISMSGKCYNQFKNKKITIIDKEIEERIIRVKYKVGD